MNALLFSFIKKFSACFAAIIFAIVFATPAHAVLIDFDDLTYIPLNPEFPSFGDTPLYDQYQSQGLLIGNAFLLPYGEGDNIISWSNFLLAGASGGTMVLSFVGKLPTYVGMYIGGDPAGVLYTIASGPGFYASHEKEESGWEYVSFKSATGIAQIEMWATQQTRVSGAMVDDITFTYVSVPEPSPLGLLGLPVLILFGRHFNRIS